MFLSQIYFIYLLTYINIVVLHLIPFYWRNGWSIKWGFGYFGWVDLLI